MKYNLPTGYLSATQVTMHKKCGLQYYKRYIEGKKRPPGIALIEGSSHHASLEYNNKYKVKQHEDRKVKQLVSRFEDEFDTRNKEVEDWGYDSVCIMEREGKLHPAKSFRGITRSNGFPDFIAFRDYPDCWECDNKEVIGVEVKTNGILSKIEKERCSWYLDNNIFSKILIASKSEFAENNIVYKEYERGLKKNDN